MADGRFQGASGAQVISAGRRCGQVDRYRTLARFSFLIKGALNHTSRAGQNTGQAAMRPVEETMQSRLLEIIAIDLERYPAPNCTDARLRQ
jgi:hypothetical protein